METPIRFYVIFTSASDIFDNILSDEHQVYGPFKSASAAKSWMTQEFNDACEAAKKDGKEVRWNWNDERLGSCKIEGAGLWEIVKN